MFFTFYLWLEMVVNQTRSEVISVLSSMERREVYTIIVKQAWIGT